MSNTTISIETAREACAEFLELTSQGVARILEEPGNGFFNGTYVSVWDTVNQRGKVCDMSGWMPVLRPDIAMWHYVPVLDKVVVRVPGAKDPDFMPSNFLPSVFGLPMTNALWMVLEIPGAQSRIGRRLLKDTSTFNEVSAFWLETAARIRAGELDKWLELNPANND